MGGSADDVVAALAEQHDELAGVLASLADADWERPSRCEGWTVADVVLHLAQTDELAVASLEGRMGEAIAGVGTGIGAATNVDEMVESMVAGQRGQSGPALGDRWRAGAEALRGALDGTDLSRRVVWVAGELTARTLATARLAETWIHTGDVAAAVGKEPAPTDRLEHVARLAWRMVPYAFGLAGRELSGPVAFHLTGPGGEAWDFVADAEPATVIRGDGVELCSVAARRVPAAETGLVGEGPDAAAVLDLLRTYA